ncbi:MAG: hypothetical protein ACKO1F_06000 [Flammeovirgaceae bacterium]
MKKLLNILIHNQSKVRIGVLIVFVVITWTSLTTEFLTSNAGDKYFVAHEDEVIYYGSAQVFAETGSLQAESCINEDVSPIGKYNWYGPGYNVVYGSLQKIVGQSNALFIKFHFVLGLLTLVTILLLNLPLESKLVVVSILLTTEQLTCYIFSYFPETLHLFFSTTLVLVLLPLYGKQNPDQTSNPWLILFIFLVVIFSLCRVTTIFWMAALLPLGSSWRQRVPYLVIFVFGITASLLYLKFFIAPPFAVEMHKLQNLYSFSLVSFIDETWKAIKGNLTEIFKVNSVPIYLLLLLIGSTLYNYWKTKDKFQLAALFVSLCLVGVLMAYYSVSPFYFVKQTAMLLPLLLIAFVRGPHLAAKWMLFGIFIYFWVPVNKKRTKVIEEHQQAYAHFKTNEPLHQAFQKIKAVVEPTKDLVILWCYNEYDYGGAA